MLFNKCIETGNIPEKWRKSIIRVLFKGKGNREDPNSYRGVALENNTFKMFTRIITDRLTQAIDHIIPEEQFGFRKGRSTL